MTAEGATIRQQIVVFLTGRALNAREISGLAGISEKEVNGHLPHIARTLAAHGKKLQLHPSRCQACGYVFRYRQRFQRPGRCPHCRGSHLTSPCFEVEA